ncbi:Gamma-aminobutyric acid type B receptor subunit 1 [Holothuria leucospilota]|uniref:Gamma-aminobutyric acid type B receptor subunit 2 n=1 Tax=Holothuria leucospilota TaxID=206669 RepID=A0A9Q1HG99_HOLLE|nr:Gamma-aminobutyric acid type B receptor subunit 1 [Holothuria leucospilota]
MGLWMRYSQFILILSICHVSSCNVTMGTTLPYTGTSSQPLFSVTTQESGQGTQEYAIKVTTETWYTDGSRMVTRAPTIVPSDGIPLYLAGLFSLSGVLDGSGIYVAADLALKHINENPNVLPGYRLVMTLSNSQCNDGVAIKKFFEQLFQEPTKLMVLGPACSPSAQAIASTAHFWNLNVMSPTASSPSLSNRKRYPKFFRIIPSETLINPPRISLMKLYNWTRVATIHQNRDLFALSIDDLLTRLKGNNITIISSESFDEDPKNQVENLKKQDAKIIVASMYEWTMRKVFCEVYKLGMYGEGYSWLIPGWYPLNWYTVKDDDLDCTINELIEVVESSMYIGTQERLLGERDAMTVAGITPGQYEILLREHFNREEFAGYTLIRQASYGYDAVWAIALALNQTAETLTTKIFKDGSQRALENFTLSDKEMGDIIFRALESVNFFGVSGPVSFEGGDRIGAINVKQLQGQCSDGWTNYGRYCYLFVVSQKSWDEAANHCRDEGGYLVSILSEDENEALMDIHQELILEGISQWWLSLKHSAEGDLSWSFGTEKQLKWTPWQGDTVTNLGSCYVLDFSLNSWQPVPCTSEQSFICKSKAEFEEIVVAVHNVATDELAWIGDIIWPGGEVPLDHTRQIIFQKVEIYEGIPFIAYIITCCIATLGMLLAIVCLVFNITYRKQRFIKMSSPNLNSLIIIGCILIYASACMAGWDDPTIDGVIILRLCQIRLWCLSTGFVLSFGSMFSKTWRVHKVAALKNPKRVIITDRHLFVMVAVLLLVDVVVLTAWFVINPWRLEKEYLHEQEDLEKQEIGQPYILYCTSNNILYWQAALYTYKGLLLIFGVFLAWETRKVTIPALNDSKLIGICVYNVVLLSAIGLAVALTIPTDPSVSFIFTSAIQLFCTSVTLVIIFIPKIVSVIQYPEGKAITTMKSESVRGNSENDIGLREEVAELRAKLKELQARGQWCKHTGCGLWCLGVMCGCGDIVRPKPEDNLVVTKSEIPTTIESST